MKDGSCYGPDNLLNIMRSDPNMVGAHYFAVQSEGNTF